MVMAQILWSELTCRASTAESDLEKLPGLTLVNEPTPLSRKFSDNLFCHIMSKMCQIPTMFTYFCPKIVKHANRLRPGTSRSRKSMPCHRPGSLSSLRASQLLSSGLEIQIGWLDYVVDWLLKLNFLHLGQFQVDVR
jgi:hypothetical protein